MPIRSIIYKIQWFHRRYFSNLEHKGVQVYSWDDLLLLFEEKTSLKLKLGLINVIRTLLHQDMVEKQFAAVQSLMIPIALAAQKKL